MPFLQLDNVHGTVYLMVMDSLAKLQQVGQFSSTMWSKRYSQWNEELYVSFLLWFPLSWSSLRGSTHLHNWRPVRTWTAALPTICTTMKGRYCCNFRDLLQSCWEMKRLCQWRLALLGSYTWQCHMAERQLNDPSAFWNWECPAPPVSTDSYIAFWERQDKTAESNLDQSQNRPTIFYCTLLLICNVSSIERREVGGEVSSRPLLACVNKVEVVLDDQMGRLKRVENLVIVIQKPVIETETA